MTETYTAITPDGMVESIDQVQVRRVTEVQKDWGVETSSDVLTLNYLNTRLAVLKGQILELKAEAEGLIVTKASVEGVAAKVVLKVSKPITK